MRFDPEADEQFRGWLDDLLARELVVAPQYAWVVFRLRAVRDAQLVHLERPQGGADAVADIGGGHLVRVRVTRYPSEAPAAVRYLGQGSRYSNLFDANDMHVELDVLDDSALEGSVLRCVERQPDNEARRHHEPP